MTRLELVARTLMILVIVGVVCAAVRDVFGGLEGAVTPANKAAVLELRRFARRFQREADRLGKLPYEDIGFGWMCALNGAASEIRERVGELSGTKRPV